MPSALGGAARVLLNTASGETVAAGVRWNRAPRRLERRTPRSVAHEDDGVR